MPDQKWVLFSTEEFIQEIIHQRAYKDYEKAIELITPIAMKAREDLTEDHMFADYHVDFLKTIAESCIITIILEHGWGVDKVLELFERDIREEVANPMEQPADLPRTKLDLEYN